VNKTIEYAVNEALNIGRLSANVKFYEAELREKIAQEIERFTITWQEFPGGFPLHGKCPNCNAEPYTPVCDSSRDYFAQSIYQHIAKIVRGNNDRS
jgi:hypothetical protein